MKKSRTTENLRVEALERFNNNWLQVLANAYLKLFVKKNDLHITIDHIPKNRSERKLVSRIIANAVYRVLHTTRLPTHGDSVLLASILNYSVKLDNVFYAPHQSLCQCLETDEMREFCTSVEGKKCTGVLKDNVDPSNY